MDELMDVIDAIEIFQADLIDGLVDELIGFESLASLASKNIKTKSELFRAIFVPKYKHVVYLPVWEEALEYWDKLNRLRHPLAQAFSDFALHLLLFAVTRNSLINQYPIQEGLAKQIKASGSWRAFELPVIGKVTYYELTDDSILKSQELEEFVEKKATLTRLVAEDLLGDVAECLLSNLGSQDVACDYINMLNKRAQEMLTRLKDLSSIEPESHVPLEL